MGVSIVIPNYNGKKFLEACINSLINQTLQPQEIIIVDNDSKDGSIEYIEDNFKDKVTLICLDKNYGFSKAVNEGIKRSKSEFTVLLNNDTEQDERWLEELVKCIKKDEKIFSCCSQMLRFTERDIIDDAGAGAGSVPGGMRRGKARARSRSGSRAFGPAARKYRARPDRFRRPADCPRPNRRDQACRAREDRASAGSSVHRPPSPGQEVRIRYGGG